MKITKLFTVLFVLTNFLFSGCKKDGTTNNNNNQTTGKGCTDPKAINYNSSATTEDGTCTYYQVTENDTSTGIIAATSTMMKEDIMIYTYVNSSSENGQTDNKTDLFDSLAVPSCASISLNSKGATVWPKTLTIDFGTSGTCAGFDGKYRKGKIHATFSGSWKQHQVGDSIKVVLENYSVNDTVITGTRYFWINSRNLPNEFSVGLKTDDASIVYPDATSITWAQNTTFVITGLSTPSDYTDDVIQATINANGTGTKGDSYALTTPSALICKMNCMQQCLFVQGTESISNTSVSDTTIMGQSYKLVTVTTLSLDFGNGTCDNNFNLTTNINISTSGSSSRKLVNETYGPETVDCSSLFNMEN